MKYWLLVCLIAFTPNATADNKFSPQDIQTIKMFSATQITFSDSTNRYAHNIDAKKLGKQLFFDVRLSANGNISCASCHAFNKSLTDGKILATGLATGTRNTPSLINIALNRWYFFDGHADSLWLQALGPIESKAEMGGDWQKTYQLFLEDATLFTAYNTIFKEYPLNKHAAFFTIDKYRFMTNIGKAIAAFEMDLKQFNSRFDVYVNRLVAGEKENNLLSTEEQEGLALFIGKAKCVQCHHGANFTDGEFHAIRLISSIKNPQDNGRYAAIDILKNNPLNTLGQYSDDRTLLKTTYLQKNESLWAAFKTPSLRNVEFTAPYMHDASKATLKDVIEHYSTFVGAAPSHHNNPLLQPLQLSETEKNALEAFLKTLSGTIEEPNY